MFHHGIWSHIRTRPQIAVGMAAHNHVHAVHAAGELTINGKAQMTDEHDMPHVLLLQFADSLFQRRSTPHEPGLRTSSGQRDDIGIGQADDAHLDPAHIADHIGFDGQAVQGTARLGVQIGGQHGVMQRTDICGQFSASLVEFMIAEGHGVIPQHIVQCGKHGPAVDSEKQRTLELVARIKQQHVVGLAAFGLRHGGDAAHAARTVGGLRTGVAVLVPPCHIRMDVVGMQQHQIKRRRGLFCTAPQQQDNEKKAAKRMPIRHKESSSAQKGDSRTEAGRLRHGNAAPPPVRCAWPFQNRMTRELHR